MPLSSRRNGALSSYRDGQLSSRRDAAENLTARFNHTKLSQSSKNRTFDQQTAKTQTKKDSKSPRNQAGHNYQKLANMRQQLK